MRIQFITQFCRAFDIGHQGDDGITKIYFCIPAEHSKSKLRLRVVCPSEEPRIINLEKDEHGFAVWVITKEFTQHIGLGECQLLFDNDYGTIQCFRILKSLMPEKIGELKQNDNMHRKKHDESFLPVYRRFMQGYFLYVHGDIFQ